ncbi:cyclic-phosphate processing receiver domain-containing protein [Paenibacillus sp. GCM10012307]|uniref:Cell division protein FtsJ n=1 Tax=Paenibacillus roseus TaxID=2798579 RepID=A0A934J5I2_9BACL|nr:cyclic-phosphate processing receiver domain-containing protein [Paenibacillus roseus]MBJ6363659.1 cell division protein FtsJ [Paenibacillus roseus]
MIHVFLDDYRRCPEGFVLALNATECNMLIDGEEIGILSLDFDLGLSELTGMEVARHIVETGRYPKEIYLHTSSPAGKMQMYKHLSEHAPADTILHFGPMADAAEALRSFGERQ